MICQTKIQNIPGFIFLTLQASVVFLFHIYATSTMSFNFQGVYHFQKP